ncbi:hypothetical protein INR49_017622 [Caranx melampygus]|nr:hypothetical protein INR49_017622 [Caranx melampygus]
MPFMVYLDLDHLVCLKWGFDNVEGNIVFELSVNTTGWIGFGLSPNGGMKGADMVIGGYGSSGSYFSDLHGTGNTMPLMDEQQNYTLLSLTESGGQTIMKFQRSIQACDDKDFHITDQTIKLIYAYGTTDEIGYHRSFRGTKDVNLLNFRVKTFSPSQNYLSVRVDNITVPPVHTYYHCKVMKFSNLLTKHHIYQPYNGRCYIGNIVDSCFGVVATWAVGGEVFEFPENAGIPFGGDIKERYYRLEVHYNNPQLESGRTDSSGLRLHYTSQLRQHDVGILTTGVMPLDHIQYNIPPKAPLFHSYGVCNTSLFSQMMSPVPDLQVFAVMLHTHLAGRKVRVGHYRNGKQIDFLGLNENYNFEIQEIISSGKIKTIKPGDEISVECTYSTVDRAKVTEMGLATTDEMCLAFLFHYPAINVTTCTSYPNAMALGNSSYLFSGQTTNQDEVNQYQTLVNTMPHVQLVSDDNFKFGEMLNGTIREMMKTPTVTYPKKHQKGYTVYKVTARLYGHIPPIT